MKAQPALSTDRMCLPAFTPLPKTQRRSPPSLSAGVNTFFNGVMDRIINNQLNLSPRRCRSPHPDRSLFPPPSTLEGW